LHFRVCNCFAISFLLPLLGSQLLALVDGVLFILFFSCQQIFKPEGPS